MAGFSQLVNVCLSFLHWLKASCGMLRNQLILHPRRPVITCKTKCIKERRLQATVCAVTVYKSESKDYDSYCDKRSTCDDTISNTRKGVHSSNHLSRGRSLYLREVLGLAIPRVSASVWMTTSCPRKSHPRLQTAEASCLGRPCLRSLDSRNPGLSAANPGKSPP